MPLPGDPFPSNAPSANPLFYRSYSRRRQDGSRESWEQVVERNLAGLKVLGHLDDDEVELLRRHQLALTSLPSGRWLWVGGTPWSEDQRNFYGGYNCLAAGTQVLTRLGYRSIEELSKPGYGPVEVVNARGQWSAVTFRCYGRQDLMGVTFGRKGAEAMTVEATADHKWPVITGQDDCGRVVWGWKLTCDLRPGDRIPRVLAPKPKGSLLGIQHGIIYGDGTRSGDRCFVDLCGDKEIELSEFFEDQRDLKWQFRCYPERGSGIDFKALPDPGLGDEHLYGFIQGLLATDGSVGSNGLSLSGSAETVAFIAEHAPRLGLLACKPRLMYAAGSGSNLGPRRSDVYRIHIARASFHSADLLRESMRRKLRSAAASAHWTVRARPQVSFRDQPVYCTTEPRTHAFVLAGGLLTGNCSSLQVDHLSAFGLLMNLAMQGTGTGAVLSRSNVSRLPKVINHIEIDYRDSLGSAPPEKRGVHTMVTITNNGHLDIKVGDSRKGWVDSYQKLIDAACDPLLADGKLKVTIDLSWVRPPGERLAGFGGVANPSALPQMYARIARVLNRATGRRLSPLECCLLIDEAARCVVAGNIRRSAGMRQFDEHDDEAAGAKHNLWVQDEEGHWSIDPERDALRMANHTRLFHHKPSHQEVVDAVRSQYTCGEGAIQFTPEALARSNADVLTTEWLRSGFLEAIEEDGLEAGATALSIVLFGKSDLNELDHEQRAELDHRMSRYGLNPCGEVLGSDFLCNLAEVHLNRLAPNDEDGWMEAFQAAAITVAALLHHRFRDERLRFSRELDPIVGVSFTGLFDFFVARLGIPWLEWWAEGRPPTEQGQTFCAYEVKMLQRFRQVVESTVAAYCERHGLKIPNRCTTVQPAGCLGLEAVRVTSHG
ncbi:MAG: ribonucleoside-triphosphate reductase, adenosylcobalamin-dependent, partial [Cyanobium sp.]|nr:ribonucleoside-triphosphate reductase, adenosylcobalamin-dependent [Cyanobium sp.]